MTKCDRWGIAGPLALIGTLTLAAALLVPVASAAVGEDIRGLLRDLFVQPPSREVSAPPFSLSGIDGAPIRLADYKGRPVMTYFWTTY